MVGHARLGVEEGRGPWASKPQASKGIGLGFVEEVDDLRDID